MKQLFQLSLVALALMITANTAMAQSKKSKADAKSESVELVGILKSKTKSVKGKEMTMWGIKSDDGKTTFIAFKLNKGEDKPDLEPLKDKKVKLIGEGSSKVKGKTTRLTITKLTSLEAAE